MQNWKSKRKQRVVWEDISWDGASNLETKSDGYDKNHGYPDNIGGSDSESTEEVQAPRLLRTRKNRSRIQSRNKGRTSVFDDVSYVSSSSQDEENSVYTPKDLPHPILQEDETVSMNVFHQSVHGNRTVTFLPPNLNVQEPTQDIGEGPTQFEGTYNVAPVPLQPSHTVSYTHLTLPTNREV